MYGIPIQASKAIFYITMLFWTLAAMSFLAGGIFSIYGVIYVAIGMYTLSSILLLIGCFLCGCTHLLSTYKLNQSRSLYVTEHDAAPDIL